MKKLNSNFIPVSKDLANAIITGSMAQLAATDGAILSGGGGGGGATVLGIVTREGAVPANVSLVAGTLSVLDRQGSTVNVNVG
jgi:hypothetical protein